MVTSLLLPKNPSLQIRGFRIVLVFDTSIGEDLRFCGAWQPNLAHKIILHIAVHIAKTSNDTCFKTMKMSYEALDPLQHIVHWFYPHFAEP